MGKINNHDYFERRAAASRSQADSAKDPQARAIHLDLATRYERAAVQTGMNQQAVPD